MCPNLDGLDARILEGLGELGPRNLRAVAKFAAIPLTTLRRRLSVMRSRNLLFFSTAVYHTNLGMRKAVVFAEASPGWEETLFDCLKANDYWYYIRRCYGMGFEGCYAVYTIPKDHCADFEAFIRELERLGVARSTKVLWSTCFHGVNPTSNWFDPASQRWVFPWNEWLDEVEGEGTDLPFTLRDPTDWPIKADEIDALIIHELELNPRVKLRELAKKLGLTLNGVKYHFVRHVLGEQLVEGFVTQLNLFDPASSDWFTFLFHFPSHEKMAKFARSLIDKPFVFSLGKILGREALVGHLSLPKDEFRRFVRALSKLAHRGSLESYSYAILELKTGEDEATEYRSELPFKLFKDRLWIYDHQSHLERLHDTVAGSN